MDFGNFDKCKIRDKACLCGSIRRTNKGWQNSKSAVSDNKEDSLKHKYIAPNRQKFI